MRLKNNLKKLYKHSKISKIYKYNKKVYNVKERGVTMLSLVVTIVILLILAGITIKFALNDNGIIKQSMLASEKYKNSTVKEQIALNEAIKEMQKTSSESGESGGTSDSDAEETIDELNKQIEDLKKQVTDLNGQVNDLNGEVSDLNGQISNLTSKQATGNATTSQVLKGATFSNSTGIGLTGTMVNHSAVTGAVSVGTDGSKVYLRTSQGAYLTNSSSGYPEISANISDINNATGYKYTKTQYDNNYNSGYNVGYNAGKSSVTIKTASTGYKYINGGSTQVYTASQLGISGTIVGAGIEKIYGASYAPGNVTVSYTSGNVTIYRDTTQGGTVYYSIIVYYK